MKRSIKFLLAVVAILAVMCTGAGAASNTTTNVKYLEDGVERIAAGPVYVIDAQLEASDMDKEWYVVNGSVELDLNPFTNSTAVNIILADGAKLDTGMIWSKNAPLTIYAQSTDRDKMGAVFVNTILDTSASWAAINSASHITIHGGWIKARIERTVTTTGGNAAYALSAEGTNADITVGAGAIVEAECIIVSGGSAGAISAVGSFISSGDVTAKVTASGADQVSAILATTAAKIVGGVCRATATGGVGSAGIDAGTDGVAVKGGWVESIPKIPDATTKDHTDGVLIDGDKGAVMGKTVIPAGMTATVREGVAMTVENGAQLKVEPGATFDASKGTLDSKGKIENDGTLKLPETMKPEDIKALGITGPGEILKGSEPVHADGERSYDGAISTASKKFDASAPWTPASGDWEIVISMDSTVEIDGVSIDGTALEKDAEWSIKAAQTGDLSAKAETTRTVVISAETLSALVDETEPKGHALRITMTDDGYAVLTFWVGTEKLPSDDGPTTPTRRSSSGACDMGFGLVAIAGLAALALRKRSK